MKSNSPYPFPKPTFWMWLKAILFVVFRPKKAAEDRRRMTDIIEEAKNHAEFFNESLKK